MVQIKGKLLYLLVNRNQELTLRSVRQLWLWRVFSSCIYCSTWAQRQDVFYVHISMNIHIFAKNVVCVCVHSIKVFSSQSRSKPSSSVAAAVREPVPEWKERWTKGRVQPPEKSAGWETPQPCPSWVLSSSLPPSTTTKLQLGTF